MVCRNALRIERQGNDAQIWQAQAAFTEAICPIAVLSPFQLPYASVLSHYVEKIS